MYFKVKIKMATKSDDLCENTLNIMKCCCGVRCYFSYVVGIIIDNTSRGATLGWPLTDFLSSNMFGAPVNFCRKYSAHLLLWKQWNGHHLLILTTHLIMRISELALLHFHPMWNMKKWSKTRKRNLSSELKRNKSF